MLVQQLDFGFFARVEGPLRTVPEERNGGVGRGMDVVGLETAARYAWGDGCEGWHLVRAPGLSVILERMPPGTAEVRHRHATARQFFYVLEGGLSIDVEGRTQVLETRQGLEIAPGEAHEVRNTGAQDARFLVISQPPAQGDRVPA